ncbi:uncharacterized protein DEA37_0005084 [Paragonimus westermani]|uniref:DH domain-containing protein n=1 Tax=Paragonimus westermani TaxID=34504 RepID=A0A5J4NY41_9TREM|nr:uncharacterized protein DEA37_0005084 [Paragonimus westermani]
MDQFNKIHDNLFLNLEPAQMFNNLVQVYQSNLRLWFGYLHKAYTRVRDSADLMTADILEPGFMQELSTSNHDNHDVLGHMLHAKNAFEIDQLNTSAQIAISQREWADSNGLEHREPLWDQLAKPFKRVTQYCLMLENIRKYCDSQEELNSVSRMVAHISAFVRLIDNQINHLEPREEMDALVDELMFPDYNENPGDEYQYFYDHFRRSSLLEDIELPAPVVLTMPEVRPILDSFVLDQDSWMTSNETSGTPISGFVSPSPASESAVLGNSLNSQQKFDRGGATRESNQSMFDPHIITSRSNSLKQDITTPLIDIQPDSIQVYLCKWSPPKSYNISKLSPNVLDRIRTANMPVGLRRTVPRRLLHKGTLRFRERQGKWTDVTCFILTDQFLITKSYKRENTDRYKVYKTPVRLDKLVINKMSENCFVCAVLDDFHMITHLYTFVTGLMHTDEWCSHLRKAKAEYLYMMRPEVLIATAVLPTTNPLLRSTDSAAWSTSEDPVMRDSSTPSPARPATLLSLTKATGKKIAVELNSPSSTLPFQGKHSRPQIPFFPNEYSGLIITDNRVRPILSPSVFEVASGSQTTVGKPRHHTVKPYSMQPQEDSPVDQLTKTESTETTVSHGTSGTPQASTKAVFANGIFATPYRPSTAGSPSHTETNLTISHESSISSSEPSHEMDESSNRQHRVVHVKSSDTADSNNLSQSLNSLNGLQFIPTHVVSDGGSHKARIPERTIPPKSKNYDEQDNFTRSCATPTNRSSVRIIRANVNSTGTSRL